MVDIQDKRCHGGVITRIVGWWAVKHDHSPRKITVKRQPIVNILAKDGTLTRHVAIKWNDVR